MIAIQIFGAKKLIDTLQSKLVDKSSSEPFRKLVLKAEAKAKKSTVVDTGRLRSSISHKIQNKTGIIETNVDYAEFVEFGTQKMEARHMEGSAKVLGEGMFAYTIRDMADELKDFETKVVSGIEKAF